MTGWIFAAVLHAFTGTEIPMPDSGIWAHAGMVRGGRADTAWRLMDAQYWGEPAFRSVGGGCSSWRILQENVPQKYYLSPAVCSRILRLAAKSRLPAARGDRIPAAQAGRQVPVVRPFQLRRMRSMAKQGDQKGFRTCFGRNGEPFPNFACQCRSALRILV